MAKIIGVKFKDTAKVYYFSPANDTDRYPVGSGVIVDTAKGNEYGKVVFDVREISDDKLTHALKPVIRKATQKDEKTMAENEKKIPEVMKYTQEQIEQLKLEMKLISCEYSYDGKKLAFYFTAENRVDFRELVKVLASKFHTRIELRQVGIRDETKMLGGIAPCGRTCCCAGAVADFGKVTIKMAKNQGLHLNPSKISGLCGRLMCCLEYENDYYAEVYPKMPKIGGTVTSPEGEGVVVSNDMLKMISKVKIQKPDGGEVYKDFAVSDLKFKKSKQPEENQEDLDKMSEKVLE